MDSTLDLLLPLILLYIGCLFILEEHLHVSVEIRACWWYTEYRRFAVEASDQLALLYQTHVIISTATFSCSYLDQLWNIPITSILPEIPKKMQCFHWRTLKTVSWVSVSPSKFQESFFLVDEERLSYSAWGLWVRKVYCSY